MSNDNIIDITKRGHPSNAASTPDDDTDSDVPAHDYNLHQPMNTLQTPPYITIPTPMHTPIPRNPEARTLRGPHAHGLLSTNMRVRLSRNDRNLVEEISASLNMGVAEFLRWCAVHTARQIKKL